MLVDLVLLYGAEVWDSCGQLAPIEKIQLRVSRIFLEGKAAPQSVPSD